MNFQALFEVQEMVLFMADLVRIELAWDEMRFNASVSRGLKMLLYLEYRMCL